MADNAFFPVFVSPVTTAPLSVISNTQAISETARPADIHARPRLLAACLLASMVLHALVFLLVPGWRRLVTEPPAPVLEVSIVVTAAPVVAVTPLPAAPPSAQPQRRQETPSRPVVLREATPQQPGTALPAVDTVPAPEVVAARPEPRAVAESKAPAARTEPPVTPPLFNVAYLRNPAPAYPVSARRGGDQGTVMLKVLVSAEGAPVRVELEQTSGSPALDNAALDAVKGWRFVPARRGAQNVEGWVRVPVVFRLES